MKSSGEYPNPKQNLTFPPQSRMRTMRKIPMRWRWKTIIKLITAVFVVTTFIVHYTNQKLERTGLILKGIGNRNVKDMVLPWTDTFLINKHWWREDVNSEPGQEDPYLVIVVTSQPDSIDRRNNIRNSWIRYEPPKNTLVVFFTGKPTRPGDLNKLQKESDQYKDLIVDDFEESYYSLTVKTLRILKWFTMNLPKSTFLVKTDDDVFVNTPKLVDYLSSQKGVDEGKFKSSSSEGERHYMGGVPFKGRSPHTMNTFSKWYVPPKLWKEVVSTLRKLGKEISSRDYPPYLEGNFYAMSGKTVPLLLNSSLLLPLYHLEDVFLTGFVASAVLNIELDKIPNLYTDSAVFPEWNYKWNKMFLSSPKDIVAYHCDKEVGMIKKIYEETEVK